MAHRTKKPEKKFFLLFTLLIALLLLPSFALAAFCEDVWSQTYGWVGIDDRGYEVQQTDDGGNRGYVIGAGTDLLHVGSGEDIWIIKTDNKGDTCDYGGFGSCNVDPTKFSERHPTQFYDFIKPEGTTIQQTLDGGYVFSASGRKSPDPDNFGFLLKTNDEGQSCVYNATGNCTVVGPPVLFAKKLGAGIISNGSRSEDYLYDARQKSNGEYIAVGTSSSFALGINSVWLIKMDDTGGLCSLNGSPCSAAGPPILFSRVFGGAISDTGTAVRESSSGGYIVLASTQSFGSGPNNIWVIKTNSDAIQPCNGGGCGCDYSATGECSNGTTSFAKIFGGAQSDSPRAIMQTSEGGYIIVGNTASFGPFPLLGITDIWLIKIDSSGNEEWNKTFGGNYNDSASAVWQTSDGGYVITGTTVSFGPNPVGGKADSWVIKTDSSGNTCDYVTGNGDCSNDTTSFAKTFGGDSSDYGGSIQQTLYDGGYIISGGTRSYGTGGGASDVWLFKLDEFGNSIWACGVCGDAIVNEIRFEDCDDGGKCTGDHTTACTSDDDCSVVGGTCTPRDGDGCSAECKIETEDILEVDVYDIKEEASGVEKNIFYPNEIVEFKVTIYNHSATTLNNVPLDVNIVQENGTQVLLEQELITIFGTKSWSKIYGFPWAGQEDDSYEIVATVPVQEREEYYYLNNKKSRFVTLKHEYEPSQVPETNILLVTITVFAVISLIVHSTRKK